MLTSAREAEVLDWRLGEPRRLTRVTREPDEEHGQSTTPYDQRARRERDRQLRWIEDVAAEAFRLAGKHGSERLLISGDERLTAPLVDALPLHLRADALRDARRLHERPAGPGGGDRQRLGQDRAGRNVRLSQRVRAAALGAHRGALGLSEVVAALNEGRAEHVIYDSALRYSGAIAPDGSLLAAGEAPGLGKEEPRLLERILERALHTGARARPSTEQRPTTSRTPVASRRCCAGDRGEASRSSAFGFARSLDRDAAAAGSGFEHGLNVRIEAGKDRSQQAEVHVPHTTSGWLWATAWKGQLRRRMTPASSS